jgi:hypothetical protein
MGLAIAALGVGCILRPTAIQGYVVRTQPNNPFVGWMQRPSYRAYLRFMGLVIVTFGALVVMLVAGILQRCC